MVSPRRLACVASQFPFPIALSWNNLCLLQTAKVDLLTTVALILQGRDTRIEKGSYKQSQLLIHFKSLSMQAHLCRVQLVRLLYRGRSRGRAQGCAPPSPEMTCGFLIQLVFCIKICLRHQLVTPFLSGALLPKKNPESAPAFRDLNLPRQVTILKTAQIGKICRIV